MKWHLQSVRELGIKDGSHVLLTLSTLEGKSGALPFPLRVNNVVRLFKLLLENNKLFLFFIYFFFIASKTKTEKKKNYTE